MKVSFISVFEMKKSHFKKWIFTNVIFNNNVNENEFEGLLHTCQTKMDKKLSISGIL